MNNTLFQHSYGVDYPFSSEGKCLSQDRAYANSSLPVSDYLERRSGLVNGSLGQPLTIGGAGSELDYSSSSIGLDTSYNSTTQQLMLSPPQSLGTTNSTSSTFSFSPLPKTTVSNASGSEQYSVTTSAYMQPTQTWSTSGITADTLRRGPQMTLPTASQNSFGSASGLNNHMFGIPRSMDSYGPMKPIFPSMPSRELFPPHNAPIFPQSSQWTRPISQCPKPAEGPPFEDTKIIQPLINQRNGVVQVEIMASIPKGFFQVDHKWTCYRRNYFTISCAFVLKNYASDRPVFIHRHSQPEMVQSFAVSISAKTAAGSNQESEIRGLVQHTPKRSKDTETIPSRVRIMPASTQPLISNHDLPHGALYTSPSHLGGGHLAGYDTFSAQPQHSIPSSHTFERIQFQKATANNGKRRAQQQYFHVVVELQANVGHHGGSEEWVAVAIKQSQPMVVRGRSPGHYKGGRRESTASMDPDHGSEGADGHATGYNMQGLSMGHAQAAAMEWTSAARHDQYSGHYARNHCAHPTDISDNSSLSTSRSTTLTASPTDEVFLSPHKRPATFGIERHMPMPIPGSSSIKQGYGGIAMPTTRAGVHEEDESDRDASTIFGSSLGTTYIDPSFDFSVTGHPRTLCT